ncbi:MAG: OstA-like protein [Bacteroidales bacterium]|jgi:lipopolysaccharide export system protein LptA|nr:OstA-like protein [Bacteroidales bacterium]
MGKRLFQILFLAVFCWLMMISSLFAQNKEQIKILNSNSLEYSKRIGEGVRRFLGDVIFEHNNAKMYCDSAYLYSKQNIIHAYSNVHLNRGDTLHLYGDFMKYNGNSNVGNVRRNVVLKDENATLTTDSLDFNTETSVAYYFEGAKIVNKEKNTLESIVGYYYANDDLFVFKDSVVVETPDYTVYTDTLKYNTETEIAYFLGPTDIYNEDNHLYAEHGWYKIQEKKFQFTQNARYQNKEKILVGDSLYFDDSTGIGIAIDNIEMIDTAENMILKGHYAYYLRDPEKFMVTDSAVLIQVAEPADSLFLHADTLRSHYDTSGTYRILKAYHKVQMYRDDFQARCDSMVYSFKDSVVTMYHEPVLWAEGSQMTADLVKVHTQNQKINFFHLLGSSLIISLEEADKYNQIRGKEMKGYIRNNHLYKVDVFGNGQSIYYTKDQNDIVGVNFAESSDLVIYLKEGQVSRINMIKQPTGTLYPPGELEETKLKGFNWFENLRPKSKADIFYWKK